MRAARADPPERDVALGWADRARGEIRLAPVWVGRADAGRDLGRRLGMWRAQRGPGRDKARRVLDRGQAHLPRTVALAPARCPKAVAPASVRRARSIGSRPPSVGPRVRSAPEEAGPEPGSRRLDPAPRCGGVRAVRRRRPVQAAGAREDEDAAHGVPVRLLHVRGMMLRASPFKRARCGRSDRPNPNTGAPPRPHRVPRRSRSIRLGRRGTACAFRPSASASAAWA